MAASTSEYVISDWMRRVLSLSLCNSGGHNCKLSAFGLAFNAADCFIDCCTRACVCMFVHSSDQMTVFLGDSY